jgi:hypothetical protein
MEPLIFPPKTPPEFSFTPETINQANRLREVAFVKFLYQSFTLEPTWVVHAEYIEGGDHNSDVELIFDTGGSPPNAALEACWEEWRKVCSGAFMGQAVDEEDDDFPGLKKSNYSKFLTDYQYVSPHTVATVVSEMEASTLKSKHRKVIKNQPNTHLAL